MVEWLIAAVFKTAGGTSGKDYRLPVGSNPTASAPIPALEPATTADQRNNRRL